MKPLETEGACLAVEQQAPSMTWGLAEHLQQDATPTSAILDCILHHAEAIVIGGKSYRMKDRIEPRRARLCFQAVLVPRT